MEYFICRYLSHVKKKRLFILYINVINLFKNKTKKNSLQMLWRENDVYWT